MSNPVARIFVPQIVLLTGFNCLLNIQLMPPSVTVLVVLLLGYRLLAHYKGFPLPKTWVKWTITMGSFSFGYLTCKHLTGPETSIVILSLALSLKLLETVKYRDVMICLMGSIYLLAGLALNNISFMTTLIIIIDTFFILVLMLGLHIKSTDQLISRLWIWPIIKLVLKTAPLVVLLFFIFPRITINAFSRNLNQAAKIGFSENLDPGSLSLVAQSNEIAFRSKIKSNSPLSINDLYWRGGVLVHSFDLKWKAETKNSVAKESPAHGLKEKQNPDEIEYESIIDPQYGKWIFSLDYTSSLASPDEGKNRLLVRRQGGHYQWTRPLQHPLLIKGQATLTTLYSSLTNLETHELTQHLPPSNQVRELVSELQNLSNDSAEFVENLRLKFVDLGLHYTLSPGRVLTIDQLLFQKKRGFCEHFAAAFATILRQANIPARVVIGFQGGRRNPNGDYYIISSKDAHAWVEYFDKFTQHWLRVDPTQSIAPLRFELGGEAYFSLDESQRNMTSREVGEMNSPFSRFWEQTQLHFDSATYAWDLFLYKFNLQFQLDVLKGLGLTSDWFIVAFAIILTLLFVFFAALYLIRKRFKNKNSPESSLYLKFLEICSRHHFSKGASEGPLEFQKRCCEHWPDEANIIISLIQTYVTAHYSPQKISPLQWQEVTQDLSKFKKSISVRTHPSPP